MSLSNLEKNIINFYQEEGKSWFKKLPRIIEELAQYWSLTAITPVNHMSWHYVAFAKQEIDIPVVLKIGYDVTGEYVALSDFNHKNMVKVYDYHQAINALLLEQAIPGSPLKLISISNMDRALIIYALTLKTLHRQPASITTHYYPTVDKWYQAIDRISDHRIAENLIRKAKSLRTFLCATISLQYVCHGDLHMDNIVQHNHDWLVIDPKGIIGELAFEAAAFDLITDQELNHLQDLSTIIHDRVAKLANELSIAYARLIAWIFVRIMMAA